MPALKKANEEGLVDAVDGFCETVALNLEQLKEVFDLAQKLNLPITCTRKILLNGGNEQSIDRRWRSERKNIRTSCTLLRSIIIWF